MNFYDVLAAKNWSGGIPTTNFFDLLFAQSISGEEWAVYEGTLPATLNANGDNMRQYQIYGNTGGVGDRTASIFNFSENAQGDGYISNSILRDDGISPATAFFVSAYLPISQEQSYVYYTNVFHSTRGVIEFYKYDNGNYEFISRVSQQPVPPALYEYDPTKAAVVTAPSEATHMRINVDKLASQFYIVEGSTPPETFVPYGYEVPIGVKSGNLCHDIFRQGTLVGTINTARCILIPSINCTVGDTYTIKIFGSNYKYAIYGLTGVQAEQFNSGAFIESSTLVPFNSGWQEAPFTFTVTDPTMAAFTVMIAYLNNSNILPSQATQILSISNGTTPPDEYQPYYNATTPIYIGSDPLGKDEYVDYQAGKIYRRTDNLFNIDDLWDKGTTGGGDEASIFLEIPAENGTYTVGTNVPNNSNPIIASVFIASSLDVNPTSTNNGVFINRPRTITTTTGKLYIGIRVRSAAGYQTFTKETFAQYYINAVSGSLVPTTAIPYLQPTDPPVPLPALPTCQGTTIVDYAGSGAAPEKVYFEYKGGKQP